MIEKAPWSDEKVAELNRRQASFEYHPYTCGNYRCRAVLVAKNDGWHCPDCDYRQDWAH